MVDLAAAKHRNGADRAGLPPLLRAFLVGFAYYLANRAALIFPDTAHILAVVWPAAGIGLAALLLSPRRDWPVLAVAIFIAGNLANIGAGRPLFNSLGFMTANVLESCCCAWVMRWRCGEVIRFRRVRDVLTLGLCATGVNTLTALLGAGVATAAGVAPFWRFWQTWFVADGLGIFLVTPCIMAWTRPDVHDCIRRPLKWVELVVMLALGAGLAWLTFGVHASMLLAPGPYMLIAWLSWPALRFGTSVLTFSTTVLAVMAIVSCDANPGALSPDADENTLLFVQLYIWCAALSAHVQQSLSLQRDSMAQKLRDNREFLNALVSQANVGIITVDMAGKIRLANKVVEDSLGYTAVELSGLNIGDVDPWAKDELRDILTTLPATLERTHRRKDGGTFPVEVTLSMVEARGERLVLGVSRDISERKRAQEALQESEANFRNFVESSIDMVWVIALDGALRFVNEQVCRTLGYTMAELRTMPLLHVYPEALRAEAARNVAAIVHGESEVCMLPLLCKDGSLVPVETRAWMGTWGGEPCMLGFSKDLSAEQEGRQLFERLFHANPALMVLSEMPERRFVDVNEAVERTSGYTREEMIGRTADELGIFVDQDKVRQIAAVLHSEKHVRGWEMALRCKDGTLRDGMFSGELIRSQGREYFLSVMLDITDRKRAEGMLRLSEERLTMALRGSNTGLWDWNVVTGEVFFDAGWAGMLGYTLDNVGPGHIETWIRLCHPDDLVESNRQLELYFSGQTALYECEVRMRHRDGRWIWVEDRGRCVEWSTDNKPLRMVGTHTDISTRKHYEELRDDMERILRHDLRSPAASAVNAARLLAMSTDLSGEDREVVQILERSGQTMLDTLNLFLELYKIESGTVQYPPEAIHLCALLRETCAGVLLGAAQRRKQCVLKIDCPDGAAVTGTPFLLRMALGNLLQNAIEASPAHGVVAVQVRDETDYVIAITNQGVVPAEIRTRFFDKYVTSGKIGGTGLGTYSARLMVECQGGSISMRTSDAQGETTVSITLPRST